MFNFHKKECGRCKDERIVHTEIIYTMQGEIPLYYCQKCLDDKVREMQAKHDREEKLRKEAEEEKARNDYLVWLKREVEIKELEEKAKRLGVKLSTLVGRPLKKEEDK